MDTSSFSRWRAVVPVAAFLLLFSACGEDGGAATITEDALPPGFEPAPTVTIDGEELTFDTIPGHYWRVLDDRGFAMGLHFQSEEPFRWAADAEENELLYMVYAIPGNCEPGGNFNEAVQASDASVLGPVLPGFDHWHGLLEAGPAQGHWLIHIPVRDFTFAGPEGNPLEGEEITGGVPEFIPVCEPR
jgi:hypothetical protein